MKIAVSATVMREIGVRTRLHVTSAPDVEITEYRYKIRPKNLVVDYLQVYKDTDAMEGPGVRWVDLTWALYGGRVLEQGNVGQLVEVTPFNIQSSREWIDLLVDQYRPTGFVSQELLTATGDQQGSDPA
jgi:hypothetical protein